MSDFAGLRIALSSLYAQRRGLELAGHNVANANTEGYSRQRVDLENVGPPTRPAFFSRWVGDGAGVRVADVIRYRDQFLEIRAALEHGAESHLEQSRAVLARLEEMFAEPGDVGVAQQLADFWAGWDDLANHPSDPAARTQLLDRANTIAIGFNEASGAITQLREDTIQELSALVDEINTTAQTIAQLNESIKNAGIAGFSTNDLQDQRDLLANKLAAMSGATVRPTEFGQVNVYLGGGPLVLEGRAENLLLDAGATPVAIRWEKDNFIANVGSGRAGGMLEAINTTLPGYRSELDAVALQLRDEVNAVHGAIGGSIPATQRDQSAAGALDFELALNGGGYATVSVAGADWSGAGGAAALQAAMQASVDAAIGAGNATVTVNGGAGQPLTVELVPTGANTLLTRASGANTGLTTLLGTTAVGADGVGGRRFFDGTSAANFALSADIVDRNSIAAGVAGKGPLDGSIALDLAELASSSSGADAMYRAFIVALGVDAQTTNRRYDIQQTTTARVDQSRDAQSGVNIDEEMVSMVQFQKAYDAAARFMTTIDQMLDTLINRTGVVGR